MKIPKLSPDGGGTTASLRNAPYKKPDRFTVDLPLPHSAEYLPAQAPYISTVATDKQTGSWGFNEYAGCARRPSGR